VLLAAVAMLFGEYSVPSLKGPFHSLPRRKIAMLELGRSSLGSPNLAKLIDTL
jgi:hypothetical protein